MIITIKHNYKKKKITEDFDVLKSNKLISYD